MSYDQDFSCWFEKVDFSRDIYVYVTVGNDGFLHPDGDTFTVSPEKLPYMRFNPAILDFKKLILTIYETIIRDEQIPESVKPHLKAAFDQEVGDAGRRSLRP